MDIFDGILSFLKIFEELLESGLSHMPNDDLEQARITRTIFRVHYHTIFSSWFQKLLRLVCHKCWILQNNALGDIRLTKNALDKKLASQERTP